MNKTRVWIPVMTTIAMSIAAGNAIAKVSEAEAAKLGKELTCVGAEAAGNADGSIPAFSGKWLGKPPHVEYTLHAGQHPVDVYPEDKPLFEITAANMDKYADRLTEGAPHRIVIFDSPPVLAASPAAELAKYVGQALVVVRADQTGQSSLEDAVSLLSACPNIQLLLNAVNFSPSGRRFGTYYGYGG